MASQNVFDMKVSMVYPLLVQKATVQATLALSKAPEVWALDYTGARQKALPVQAVAGGFQVSLNSVTSQDIYYAFEVCLP